MRFNELSLPIGKTMSLRMVGLDYKMHHLNVQLIGYVEGENLIVSIVSKPGQILLQTSAVVNFVVETPTGIAKFEAAIEHIHESPFLYLVLEYPVTIDFYSQRQHPRFPVDTPIELIGFTELGMTTASISGYMKDVSVEGARIVLKKELTPLVTKSSVGVTLSSLDVSREMVLIAQVRNEAELSDDYPECGFAYGIQFIELDDADASFLRILSLQESARDRGILCSDNQKTASQ